MLIAATVLAAADLVLTNGRVLVFHELAMRGARTERPRFEEAVAVSDGRIVFVGSSRKARKWAGEKTRVIDLGGRMVMPGIVDGHFHGTRPTDCEMGYAGGTVPDILAKLQACLDSPAQAKFAGTNVRFAAHHLFGEALEPRGAVLTRADLDTLTTTRPVLVRHSDGHKFWLNSRAIENAKLDEETPDPKEGEIARDANRRPTGVFADFDPGSWGDALPITDDMRLETARRTMEDANRMGLTSILVADKGEDEAPSWAALRDAGALTLRVSLALSANFVRGATDPVDLKKRIAALDSWKKYARDPIDVSTVKIYCDGVMEAPAQTAAMLKPYRVNAGTTEKPDWRPGTWRGPDPSCADARLGFVELDRAGWQIHIHAIGDRAVRDALDGFEAARKANGAKDLRHTITHLEAVDRADVPRFGKIGAIASMSLHWPRRDAYAVNATEGYVEDDLYERLYPAAELLAARAVIAGGSDYPVEPLEPLLQIQIAMTHTGRPGPGILPGALSPKEVIPDLLTVVKIHTLNAAYQIHQEKRTGSIEVGKDADLVVLDANLFEIPVERISATRVLLTLARGRIAWRDPGFGDEQTR
jgi:predicted amidohydrolase YtcJ